MKNRLLAALLLFALLLTIFIPPLTVSANESVLSLTQVEQTGDPAESEDPESNINASDTESEAPESNINTSDTESEDPASDIISNEAESEVSSEPQSPPEIIIMRLNCTIALLNGTEIAVDRTDPDVAPFTLMTKTMVPVRFIENLGAEVKYNGTDEPVVVTYGDKSLELVFGNDAMKKTIGGVQQPDVELPSAPTLVEGKTCVPIREIAEGIGFSVYYDKSNYLIVVSTSTLSDEELAEAIQFEDRKLTSFIKNVTGITAKFTSIAVKVGKKEQIKKDNITFTPKEVGCNKLLYSSDNEDVATVTSKGLVKGVAFGSAKITILSHNGKKAVIDVNVGSEAEIKIYNGIQEVYKEAGTDLYNNYKWTRDNITYVTMSTHPATPEGYTREQMYAVMGFDSQRGNCFVFAATFTALARGLGYNATYIEGEVTARSGGYTRHGFVIMEIDGAKYVCDPQLEYRYPDRNLYMQPMGNTKTMYRWLEKGKWVYSR